MGTVLPAFKDFIGGLVAVSPNTPLPVSNSLFQIQIGNVEGFELISVTFANDDIGLTFEDLSDVGGVQDLPTEGNPETWEIVSTSPQDATSGSGTSSVAVISLADGWVEQDPTIVEVTGTTPNTLSGSHFRPSAAVILSPDGGANVGDITIRKVGGADRLKIRAGIGNTKSSLFSVAAGKSAFAQFIMNITGKNDDITGRLLVQGDGGPVLRGLDIPLYQTPLLLPVAAPMVLPQKTDIRLQAASSNEGAGAVGLFDLLIVDNAQIAVPPTAMKNLI